MSPSVSAGSWLSDQRSRLQIVNAVSDLDAVTVEIDDEASVTLNYQEGSELLEVVPKNVGFPDSRRFSAVDPDSGDQLFSKLNSISAGDREVYVLMGSEAQDDFDLEEATLSPPEEVGTGEVAVFAAHAYHGFEERVTFTMPVGEHVSFTEDEIFYFDTNYETAIGAVEVDPNADSAGFASDSDALNDPLVKKTLTDLGVQTGGVYTFVMSGVYDGSQSEPDMFAVEGPWFKQ